MSVGARAGAGLAGLALLAGCQLVLDFSSEVERPAPDASIPDAGPPDAASLCGALEPNDTVSSPAPVEPGTFAASICAAGDEDFYSFTLDGDQDVDIVLTFEAGANDLELELYSQASGIRLTFSTGTDGDEQIRHSDGQGNQLAVGTYIVRVFGADAAVVNDYQIVLERGPIASPTRP
jgi:hypothetical protein